MNIQSQHPSLAPFLSSTSAKQLLPNHIAADPLWPSPFILICQKPLWTSLLLLVPSEIWQMSKHLCLCLTPVCENHALSNPWNCETWTNIPVSKQHNWNNKKMNVQQSHLQTLQTKLKNKSLSHQIFKFKQKFYCAFCPWCRSMRRTLDTWTAPLVSILLTMQILLTLNTWAPIFVACTLIPDVLIWAHSKPPLWEIQIISFEMHCTPYIM